MATSEDKDVVVNGSKSRKSSKKRIPGACDLCKRKKIRCDSAQMPGNRCSNCIQSNAECTHKEIVKTLGSAKSYVESLETRLEALEKLFNKLLPGVDINQEINEGSPEAVIVPEQHSSLPRNDDDPIDGDVVSKMSKLHIDPQRDRFFGKSSGYQLVQTALEIRSQYTGEDRKFDQAKIRSRRLEFWTQPSWRTTPHSELEPEPPGFIFPEEDLISSLVTAYFEEVNLFLPLLHRPSFEKSVARGLHYIDNSFGGTLLLVCALGSRYSEDPRVFVASANSPRSAGWKWYEQVPLIRKSFAKKPTLHELQNHALSALFLQSTELPQGGWTQLSMAICMVQEIGGHRHRPQAAEISTSEIEEWKRVFWILMCQHRLFGSFAGRPSILQDEDFDIEFPIECDDEYWNHPDPSLNFRQPPGKPSIMSFFICYLRLMDILAYTMRYIYSLKTPNLDFRQGRHRYSDQQIIVDLDSAMNSWMDSVPGHLRWDPTSKNKIFKKQSAALYATYYHLQMLIHRPFIPSIRNPSPTTFPSLAICANAARSSCHVLEVQSQDEPPFFVTHLTIFTAAVILLLNIWSGKRSGIAPHPKQEIEDVRKCADMLKAGERRWCSAGRFWDVINELASAGGLPLSETTAPSNKRQREQDEANTHRTPRPPPGLKSAPHTRQSSKDSSRPLKFALPMYSDELGSLPIYGQFNFLDSHWKPERATSLRDARTNDFNLRPPPQEMFHVSPGATTPRNYFAGSDTPVSLQPSFEGNIANKWDPIHVPALEPAQEGTPTSIPPSTPHNQSPTNVAPAMDNDILNMWSMAPLAGFEPDEWGTYITNVNQMTHGQFLFPDHHHH